MASHGVPRSAAPTQRSAEAREKDLKEISEYKSLFEDVSHKVEVEDFSPELLQQTGVLLSKNPEYYTMWNIRRRIYAAEFTHLTKSSEAGEITSESKNGQMLQIIQLDLQFLFPLLLKFPKCYWIWQHRLWLLAQASVFLPLEQARKIWQDELGLVGKMLVRDSRNYHGWGYRRIVVQSLESADLNGSSMARTEYEYTTKMIRSNLSNFSAWHNRSKLIIKILEEESASQAERREMLDSELALVHQALFDPYDQSLWFYHQNLISTFDPAWNPRSMAPKLSNDECLEYLTQEKEFIEELLLDADDCKWAYQALIECVKIECQLKNEMDQDVKEKIKAWIQRLKNLDPLRSGRWSDIEATLN